MKVGRFQYLYILCFALLTSCIESYPPPIIDDDVSFLVIDGSVNSSDGSARVKLSRAVALSSTESIPPELNAIVSVEDTDGNVYPLSEVGDGLYEQSNLSIILSKKYRLNVRTSDNNDYQSDFTAIKPTPAIDSIHWAPSTTEAGINILVNTHDDTNNTRYYQWSFEETYEYESVYYAFLKYVDGEVVNIPLSEQTFRCWRTLPSTKILIGSSEKLNNDIIFNFPLNFIAKGSQKTIIKYSILVKQKALSREAYDYWLNLQKTTENLGSLFDPQPGKVTGNIHNITNPAEPALGYFDVGAAQEKRIFFKGIDLPEGLRSFKTIGSCYKDTVLVDALPQFSGTSGVLLDPITEGPVTLGYTYSSRSCSDCRVQGGTTTKPLFWQ